MWKELFGCGSAADPAEIGAALAMLEEEARSGDSGEDSGEEDGPQLPDSAAADAHCR